MAKPTPESIERNRKSARRQEAYETLDRDSEGFADWQLVSLLHKLDRERRRRLTTLLVPPESLSLENVARLRLLILD